MTREEAVVVLKAFMENPLFSDVHKAAFNIAIHDIKQRHDWDINNLILINKDNYETRESIINKDCEHCSKTYGTLGCCDTVNNEWVYSCKEGQREYLLDKIRAEIDKARFIDKDTRICKNALASGLEVAMDIIDKYKSESEG